MISANRLGFWSAVLTAVIAAAHFAVGILTPARSGPFAPTASIISYPYTNVASFIPIDYVWLYPGFLLAPAFVVLMVCIHYYAADDKKIFSQIGLSFALIYAAVITTDHTDQAVPRTGTNGIVGRLSRLSQSRKGGYPPWGCTGPQPSLP